MSGLFSIFGQKLACNNFVIIQFIKLFIIHIKYPLKKSFTNCRDHLDGKKRSVVPRAAAISLTCPSTTIPFFIPFDCSVAVSMTCLFLFPVWSLSTIIQNDQNLCTTKVIVMHNFFSSFYLIKFIYENLKILKVFWIMFFKIHFFLN